MSKVVCMAVFGLLVSITTACSSKELYNFGTEMGENLAECDTRLSASDRAECEDAYRKTFEEYQRAREALLNDAANR